MARNQLQSRVIRRAALSDRHAAADDASARYPGTTIKTVIEAEHTHLSTRIAALVLLLYGIPVRRISELTLYDVEATAEQTTIRIGPLPAPIPEPLLPFFHQHLADRGNHQTMNHRTRWLFPSPAPGTTSPNKHSCSDCAGSG